MSSVRCFGVTIASAIALGIGSPSLGQGLCSGSELSKLTGSDGGPLAEFGQTVAVSGDVAVIGAPGDASTQGAVYVFKRDGFNWNEVTKIVASDGEVGDAFGFSVDATSNSIVIGAPNDDDDGINAGAVYVYQFDKERDDWTLDQKLVPFDGAPLDGFGFSVSIGNNRIVVGAPFDDEQGSDAGAAYVFRKTGPVWVQAPKLTPPTASGGDLFGSAVDNQGARLIVGAPGDNVIGEDSGTGHVFMNVGPSWVYDDILEPPAKSGDLAGTTVALMANAAVLGAPDANLNGANSGAVYAFFLPGGGGKDDGEDSFGDDPVGGGWKFESSLIGSTTSVGDAFGNSVSIGGGVLVVGANLDSLLAGDAGSAVVFMRDKTESAQGGPGGAKWVETVLLSASDASVNAEFGRAVATDGVWAMVGAWHDNAVGLNSGATYTFSNFDDCNGNDIPDLCEIGPTLDCNENGTLDLCDIAKGDSVDLNCNEIPDECDLFGDLNGDGDLDPEDLALLLQNWGRCPPVECCLGDLNFDGTVDGIDLGILLSQWAEFGGASMPLRRG